MGLIIKELEVVGTKEGTQVAACFDSGAVNSFLRRDIAERISTISTTPSPWRFTMADGKTIFQTDQFVMVNVTIKGVTVFHTFIVADDLSDDMIIGADMLQRWKIRLDPETEEVDIDPGVTRLRL